MGISGLWKREHTGDFPDNEFHTGPVGAMGDDMLLGERLGGKYLLESVFRAGGMGVLYLAEDLIHNRKVIVKMVRLQAGAGMGSATYRRFRREAHAMAKVAHANIVSVLDYHVDEGDLPYIVLEYIEGQSLKTYRKVYPKGLPGPLFMRFMHQMCAAMALIHQNGIIHRDLKPSNIMVAASPKPEHIKILDFGLICYDGVTSETAKFKLTKRGEMVGTPAYMSPEQCLGDTVGHTTDIYNLGLIAYELITGKLAFDGNMLQQLIVQQVEQEATPVTRLRPGIPAHLGAAIARAMAKKPAMRFGSCGDFWKALQGK